MKKRSIFSVGFLLLAYKSVYPWTSMTPEQLQQLQQQATAQIAQQFVNHITNPEEWKKNREHYKNNGIPPVSLEGKTIKGVDLSDFPLSNINFSGATFEKVNFKNATLNNANLSKSVFKNCNFEGASLRKTNCTGSKFIGGSLRETKMPGIILTNAEISKEVDKRGIMLSEGISKSDFGLWFDSSMSPLEIVKRQKQLSDDVGSKGGALKSYYRGAADVLSDLIACMSLDFSNQDLSKKDCSGYCFRNANLKNVNFHDANLNNTDLRGANFEGIKLSGSSLKNLRLSDAEVFSFDTRDAMFSIRDQMENSPPSGSIRPIVDALYAAYWR